MRLVNAILRRTPPAFTSRHYGKRIPGDEKRFEARLIETVMTAVEQMEEK
ncbi:MAG: hypothetical protein LBF51_03640 [Zoogloeaceae bacterium]|nr:hypothetical protein [Zoogloeaceae bacterium]